MRDRALMVALSAALTTLPALTRAEDVGIGPMPPAAVATGSQLPIPFVPEGPGRQDARPEARADRPLRLDAALIAGGQAMDLLSTEAALARCPTCGEANPLVQSRSMRVGTKTATALGLTLACHELRRSGHPRIARSLAIGAGVLGGALAVHNLRTSR